MKVLKIENISISTIMGFFQFSFEIMNFLYYFIIEFYIRSKIDMIFGNYLLVLRVHIYT